MAFSDIKRRTKRHVGQAARVGSVVTVAALSLGSVDADPLSNAQYVAKARTLDPLPMNTAAPAPVVKEEVVLEAAAVAAPAPVVATRTVRRGSCGLDYIKSKESGGNYQAVSRSGKYRGAYQFDQRTWESTGGSGDPAAASPEEQDSRAAKLYSMRGSQPWGVCGFR